MKNILKNVSAFTALSAVSLFAATTAFASSDANIGIPLVQVNTSGFGDSANSAVHLFRLGHDMTGDMPEFYGLTSNSGGIQLWKSTGSPVAFSWDKVSTATITEDSTNIDVVGFTVQESSVYVAVNATDGFEVWRWTEAGVWENVFEQHSVDTQASFVKRIGGYLYLGTYSTTTNLAQLYRSTDGVTWSEYSIAGVGADEDVARVNDIARLEGTLYAVTNDGRILARGDEETEWATVYASPYQDTSLKTIRSLENTIYVGGGSDEGGLLLSSENGSDYSVITADGFGNADNTKVTQLFKRGGRVHVYFSNANGFGAYRMTEKHDASEWELWIDNGATDAHNTAVVDRVVYRGHQYASTLNSEDGGQILLYQLRAPRVQVTSPERDSVVEKGDITFVGTAQPDNRVDVRLNHDTLGSVVADADGNWSITVTVSDTGTKEFKIFSQYEEDNGDDLGRLSRARVVTLHITE